ncbi:hypothetical protein [Fimbriiglobus ruber]|uniref:Tail terminator n=1 Tax=Fimbriiglobus ruber TaxID=1908690 RepID=A0A225D032_9BACT|nr:hypothetical protein [Fimbriiglobus ruber]OWK34970.1 hypothetical protein FRUB_09812 [Fimbriiglobus ruber]
MAELIIEKYLAPWLKARDPRLTGVAPASGQAGQKDPHLTYSRVGTNRWRAQSGPVGVCGAKIQLDVHTQNHALGRSIAETIAGTDDIPGGLDGMTGTVIGAVEGVGGLEIQRADLLDDRDAFDDPIEGQEPGWFVVRSEYVITWTEG